MLPFPLIKNRLALSIAAMLIITSFTSTTWAEIISAGNISPEFPNSDPYITGLPFYVGFDIGSHGSIRVRTGGVMETQTHTSIAHKINSSGIVVVENPNSRWTNRLSFTVGNVGHGTFNIESGATSSTKTASIGLNPTAVGITTVTGQNSIWTIAEDLTIGQSGQGTLNIENGASVSTNSSIHGTFTTYIGRNQNSMGTVNLSGQNSILSSRELIVGEHGKGKLNILGGSSVSAPNVLIGFLEESSGTASVVGAGSLLTTGSLTIGNIGGDGTLNIKDEGTVKSLNVTIGSINHVTHGPSVGIVNVTGSGSLWEILGTDPFDGLDVGSRAQGTLNISNGASVTSQNITRIAEHAGSIGEILVNGSGVGSTFTNVKNLFVGNAGNGRFRVVDSGDASNVHGIIGNGASGTGYALVSGHNARWTNHGNLTVGNVGIGTLEITNAGVVLSVNSTIGNTNKTANSVVTVDGLNSAWNNSGGLTVGNLGYGELNIIGQGTVSNVNGLIGNQTGSMGTVTVNGTNSRWTNSAELTVGNAGQGTLNVLNSAVVSNTNGIIGHQANSSGIANVTGGRWTNTVDLTVGNVGNGTLNIRSDGKVTGRHGIIANHVDSISTATVNGPNSSWTNSGDLTVGQSGHGTLHIEHESKVSSANGVIGMNTGSTGIVNVNHASSIFANPEWNMTGSLTIGKSGHGTLNITNQGRVQNQEGNIGYGPGSTGIVKVSGDRTRWWVNASDLYVGRSGHGTLNIENQSTVLSFNNYIGFNSGSTGVVTVTGLDSLWDSRSMTVGKAGHGTLNVQDQAVVFSSGNSVIGEDANATGIVHVSGVGTRWVTFNNTFVGSSGDATLNISSGGEVSTQGSGSIGLNAGSTGVVNMTGTGTDWFVTHSLTIGGAGDGTLNIRDGAKATIFSGTTTIGTDGKLLLKDAILETNNFVQNGDLALELSAPGGINSTPPLIIANSQATLAGTLTVDLLGGFSPELGDTFKILSYSSRVGSFTDILAIGAPADIGFEVIYDDTLGTATLLTVKPVPEPESFVLAGIGFMVLAFLAWKNRRRKNSAA